MIFGTGGNCVDILDTINEINERADTKDRMICEGFLDDDEKKWGMEIFGIKVLGPLSRAREMDGVSFINGIGSPNNFWRREEIAASGGQSLERFATIIHPTASVSRMSTLGRGCVIFQNVTIASRAKIGDHVIILPNSVISHDDVIGDYTCVAGGVCVSGDVKVGRECYLGANCSIIGGVEIGDRSLVGMGSVVLKSVPSNCVYAGVPARFLRNTK